MTGQAPTPDHSGESISILRVDPILDTGIVVTSTSQRPDGWLEDRHAADNDNRSPPLTWTDVPDVQAWALIVEDPDAPREKPFVHWMIWNIDGGMTALPEGIALDPRPVTPQGAVQGRNDMGQHGWFGPRPPAGHGLHHYYFQLFALDAPLEMGPETSLEALVSALKGRTIAKGEMTATYETPAPP